MEQNEFPPGWDEKRVQSVINYYENQTEDEAVAEAEADRLMVEFRDIFAKIVRECRQTKV